MRKVFKTYIALITIVSSLGLFSVGYAQDLQTQNNELKTQVQLQNEQIKFLGEVNQQSSFRWNPYLIAMDLLLALIGLGAIAVSVIIYIMGRDYRTSLHAEAEKIRVIVERKESIWRKLIF